MEMKTLAIVVATLGLAAAQEFEVASIKPNKSGDGRVMIDMSPGGRWMAKNISLNLLLQQAFDARPSQVTGGPSWMEKDRFDIEAKPDSSLGPDPGPEKMRPRLQSLLKSRFHLEFHRETKEMPVYVLVAGKNAIKMKESEKPKDGERGNNQMRVGRGQISAQGMTMRELANTLSRMLGRNVTDETGLKGQYDFTLDWTPDTAPQGPPPNGGNDSGTPVRSDGPTIFTAVQEQLGLKLESKKAQVSMFVIDRLEHPEEN